MVEIDVIPVVRVVTVAAVSAVVVARGIVAVANGAVGNVDVGELDRLPGAGVMASAAGARIVIGGRAMTVLAIPQTGVIKVDLVPVGVVVATIARSIVVSRRRFMA